jgi:type IX secretion system PorP/SprF family membrane protein
MSKQMKKLIFSFIITCGFGGAFSQQLTNFSLYRDNSFLANPAIAGSERAPVLAATYRNQWRKIEGAPNTAAISYRGRIGRSPHGIGGIIMNDQTGPTSFTSATVAYAFHLDFYKINPFYWSKFLRNSKLSFALSASIFQYRLRASMLQLDDPNDQAVAQANVSRFLPNAAAGIFYYYDNFYVGFSVPQLIPLKARFESGAGISTMPRELHYYVVAGGKISFNKNTHHIEPIAWFKTVKGAPFQYDVHLRYRYKNNWWAGVAYRSSVTAVIEAGFMIQKRFQIGYAFDQNISRLAKFTAGSHELILAYHFIKNKYGRYR